MLKMHKVELPINDHSDPIKQDFHEKAEHLNSVRNEPQTCIPKPALFTGVSPHHEAYLILLTGVHSSAANFSHQLCPAHWSVNHVQTKRLAFATCHLRCASQRHQRLTGPDPPNDAAGWPKCSPLTPDGSWR